MATKEEVRILITTTKNTIKFYILAFFVVTHSVKAGTFQEQFEQQVKSQIDALGFNYDKLKENDDLSISFKDLNSNATFGLNDENYMCSASMGKWTCAIAAAQLIHSGKLDLNADHYSRSTESTLSKGDLNAMMQASDNQAAARVCRVINNNLSPGYEKKSPITGCYTNNFYTDLVPSISRNGILNGNLFNRGRSPRCEGAYKYASENGITMKTSNVGKTVEFLKLIEFAHNNENWQNYDWLFLNQKYQSRPFDTSRKIPSNRLYKSFGCHRQDKACPIKMRKSGSVGLNPGKWENCNNDSILYDDSNKKFILIVSCNENTVAVCNNQELFDAISSVASNMASIKGSHDIEDSFSPLTTE